MGTLTIRNLDDNVKQALRERAAKRGVSMEQEVRDILAQGVSAGAETRRKISFAELMRLSQRPAAPIDLKRAQEEVWDYLYEDDRR